MKEENLMSKAILRAAAVVVVTGITITAATATEPCGELGECKALIEINATDGDIGFHFLMDGDDLVKSEIRNPDGKKIFKADAKKELREQFMTETFVESAEPLCWADSEADPEDEIVTLEEFLERWAAGTYVFTGKGEEGEKLTGETELTHDIPAAPDLTTGSLGFASATGVISWAPGVDLGKCANAAKYAELFPSGVEVAAWEVVFEPDDDALGQLKFTIRVPSAQLSVTVPADYLASLPDDTPAKIEVGAIGVDDNATFTEIFDVCVNDVGPPGCE